MQRLPLFAEPESERTRPLGWLEPAVHWLTESTRPEAVASRTTINAWYEGFPDPDGRFAARLRSEVDVDYYQVLDELYVHHLLKQRHDDVRYEEGDVGPDFRVYRDGDRIAGVEVLSLFQPKDWTDDQRQHARIADDLCARVPPTAGYFVDLRLVQADRDPAPRRFAHFIRQRLDELPPYDQIALPVRPSGNDLPSAVYEADGIRVAVRFLPMNPGAASLTDPDARIVGMGAPIGGEVTTAARLRQRVKRKLGDATTSPRPRSSSPQAPMTCSATTTKSSQRCTAVSRSCWRRGLRPARGDWIDGTMDFSALTESDITVGTAGYLPLPSSTTFGLGSPRPPT